MTNPTPQPAQAASLPPLQWVARYRCENCGFEAASEPPECPKCLGTFFVIHYRAQEVKR